ncbi:MAG: Maf family protein [Phycisphaerales bacterium]|nr:Maf family protein [Phycisphaerales bacterium]
MGKSEKIILASASPRRAELLRSEGIDFEVRVNPHKEPHRKPAGIPAELWPMCLAFIKAQAVRATCQPPALPGGRTVILGADTIVVEGERILNKARDRSHARQILASLSGKEHRVITGICLMSADGKRERLANATARCRLQLTSRQLEAYLDTGLWKGKAGAYGIQDDHDPFVTLLEGDITTVIGLPLELVKRELAAFRRGT